MDDTFRALADFGALIFLAGAGVIAVVYLARRYEARLLSENEFLRTTNSAFATALERLTEELRAERNGRRER